MSKRSQKPGLPPPPDTGGLLPLPRLQRRLEALAAEHTAVWVSGPAGSGKSSLAALHIRQAAAPSVWFRLDAADAEPQQLAERIRAALARAPGGLALDLAPPAPFEDPERGLRDLLLTVAERLPRSARWVWDNCERLPADSAQSAALAAFAERLEGTGRCLFLGQEAPDAAYCGLRAGRRLGLMDWSELRLGCEESAALAAHLAGGPVDPATAEDWYRTSAGWPAALVLLAQAGSAPGPGHAAGGGAPRELFDYLARHVLARAPAADRDLLTALSLLPHLNPALVTAYRGDPRAPARLAPLAERLHLIERDAGPRPTYRLHPLLRDFLRQRLEEQTTPARRRRLELAAGQALERTGEPEAAGDLYREARQWAALEGLVRARAEAMLADGRLRHLERWLAALPETRTRNDPWMQYWLGAARRFSDPADAWPRLEQAFHAFRSAGDVAGQYAAWHALVESIALHFEDMRPLKRWLREYEALRARHPRCPQLALRLRATALAAGVMSVVEPGHPRLRSLIRFCEAIARLMPLRAPRQAMFTYLSFHYASTGQIARLHAQARHLLPLLDDHRLPVPVRLLAYSMVGLHELLAGAAEPELKLDAAVGLSEGAAGAAFASIPRAYRIYCDALAGRLGDARARLEAFRSAMAPGHRLDTSHHDFMDAWLCGLDSGQQARALELSSQSQALSRGLSFHFGTALNAGLRVQLLANQGDMAGARRELAALQELVQAGGSRLLGVLHDYAEAWLAHRQGLPGDCREALSRALAGASEQGILGLPGLLRTVQAELAREAMRHGIQREFTARMIRRWRLTPAGLSPLEPHWPWPLRLSTLGRFHLERDGEPVDAGGSGQRRPLELLASLAAAGAREVPRTRLADALWPDSEADRALHALDNLLHRLRKLIGAEALELGAGTISLNPRICWLDTWALEAAARRPAAGPGPLRRQAQRLRALYAGPLLPASDNPLMVLERERLRALYLRAVEDVAGGLVRAGEAADAAELWERALAVEPFSEVAYLALMRCYRDQGDSARALEVYRRCQRVSRRARGAEPGAALGRLARELGGASPEAD